ncbi:DUF4209 domain-containing protein [Staphylococcus aureus]|uniref:DUF4209 domain-containing protein n=1 Tax=Staphylococcus aureus TaxID=1280 RepID=UPI002DBCC567|nr:DUF4209 domain-containing protein [Staphylococcus aureus]MEB6833236.1 DUF4209 domain-containing protein [Staphylococcus aureus]
MNIYKEKVKDLESISNIKSYTEFVEEFKKIKEWAEKEELDCEVKQAQYEIDICSLSERIPIFKKNNKEKRFGPIISFDNERIWPDIKKNSDNQFKYYEHRLNETENIFLKVRYSDFLFEYYCNNLEKTKYQISEYLLSNLVLLIEYYIEVDDLKSYEIISSISRLVEVSLLMKNKDKLKKAVELIDIQIKEFIKKREYRCFIYLSKLIREILGSKFKEIILDSQSSLIINDLEKVAGKHFEEKEYELYRVLCEELIQYSNLSLITKEKKKELQLLIGKAFELEADYQQGLKSKSLMVKTECLEQALDYYLKMGEKDKIDEIKIKLMRAYEELEKSNEFRQFSFPIQIPDNIINEIVECFVASDIQNSLDKIADSSCFIPEIKKIEKEVNKTREEYPLLYLSSKSLLSDGKKIESTNTVESNRAFIFNRIYMQHLNINVEVFLKAIFDKLISEFEISTEDFMKKFNKWDLLDKKNVPFIECGISRFLEKDYLSALHILVPQFESTVRRMFSKVGYTTTSIRKGNTQQAITFNEFLLRNDVKSSFGNDIHKLIQIVMVEQSGLNLRNEIAHGLIEIRNVNYTKCILVIYLFLILTTYNIEK